MRPRAHPRPHRRTYRSGGWVHYHFGVTVEASIQRVAEASGPEVIGGRYEVEELVGRGGMGAVYRVRDRRDGRILALKRLTLRKKARGPALRLFEREYHTLAQLSHPRIIEVYDYGLDGDGAFFTMELLSGDDMRELSPMPWQQACKHLRELATSLALLHARRLLHRDVTPRNVRLTRDGHCKLIDFGALTQVGDAGEVIGTPPCVPPEALEGKPIDQRLDLYALGCVAYWMLTGKHAYPASDSRQLRTFWARRPDPPSAIKPARDQGGAELPDIPETLDALILSLLAQDRMARPSSAGAVIDRIDVILGQEADEEVSLAESYLTSTPLVGRQGQIELVRQCLSAVQRGRGSSIALIGETGMGRTRLLSEVELTAKLGGALTLSAAAEEHPRPYGTAIALASQLLSHLPDVALEAAAPRADVLSHLLPELPELLGKGPPPPRNPDPLEWRTACQSALGELFADVAGAQPLALLVDDAHRCDEASGVLLATLAHEARGMALLVVVTVRSGDEPISETALSALMNSSRELQLTPLYGRDSRAWLESIFGDAPNLPRLSEFLHDRSGGSPGTMMELLSFLLERGDISYREGTWALPNEPGALALPQHAREALAQRLARLPEAQRGLAELLSMHRGALTLGLCRALWQGRAEGELVELLDALVEAQVLTAAIDGYRFTSESLRELLCQRIRDDDRPALHLRMAEAMLTDPELTNFDRLAAGLHLLEADDDRGSDLVIEAAFNLARNFDNLSSSVRLVEAALEKFRSRNEPIARKLVLLVPLGLATYMVDRSYERYEAEIAEAIDHVTGLGIGRWMQVALGKLGGLLGLGIGFLRYQLQPRRARPFPWMAMFQLGSSALMTIAGKASVCLDRAAVNRIAARVAPLAALGLRHPGGFTYAFCQALSMVTEDRYARTYAHMQQLEQVLADPTTLKGLPAEARRLWQGGVNYVMGLLEGFRGDPRALERADTLDAAGVDLHQLIAAQLRLQYHGFRGEAEEVRKAYDRMETSAIQAGSTWQVEAWAPIAINLFGALWGDLIITKRAMKETERMREQIPTIDRYAVSAIATYELLRGKPEDCVRTYAKVLPQEEPLSRIGWSTSHGLLAQAHNQLGEHGTAKALCEEVLATVDPADEPYYAMRIAFELPYAIALASLEHYGEAEAHLQKLLDRYERTDSPLVHGLIHETFAQVAWLQGDRRRFTKHLKQVEHNFTSLANPALIARFQRLTDIAGSGGGMGAKVAVMREVNAFDAALLQIEDVELGARHILAWLMKQAEGYEGFLFARGWDEPMLLAATAEREPPSELYNMVEETLRSLGGDADTTNFGTGAATETRRDGSARHIFLLSYFDNEEPRGEGALVLLGRGREVPPVRYELLQAAAQQLQRLRGEMHRDSIIP